MTKAFAAQVQDEIRAATDVVEVIFRESVQEMVEEMDLLLVESIYDQPTSPSGYQRTGFLRAALVASTTAMPQLERDNPGAPVAADLGDVMLVISGADLGQVLYVGYTAVYAARVHYGFVGQDSAGRTFNGEGRPWVTLAAQRWETIVARVEARVRQRMGL